LDIRQGWRGVAKERKKEKKKGRKRISGESIYLAGAARTLEVAYEHCLRNCHYCGKLLVRLFIYV
jgi:hypothetical protein